MRNRLEQICKTALLMLAGVMVAKPYLALDVSLATFFLGMVILLTSLPLMDKPFLRPTTVLLTISVILFRTGRQPFSLAVDGVNSILNIVGIIVIMQFFSIPVRAGGYDRALEFLMSNRFKRGFSLFLFIISLSHLLGSFLLFGTIPVMMSLLGDGIKSRVKEYERFSSAAITRGYSLVAFWAPGAISVLLVLQVSGLKWSDIFLPGFILSIAGIITSSVIEARRMNKSGDAFRETKPSGGNATDERDAWLKIVDIMVVVFCLILLTVLQERLGFAGASNRAMTAAVIVILAWLLKCRKTIELGAALQRHWDVEIRKVIDLAGMFTAMGLFSRMVEHSGLIGLLEEFLVGAASSIGFLSLALIPITVIMCSVAGIHPYISMVLLGNIFFSIDIGIRTLPLALALTLGGVISYTLSPFAGIVLTMAKYIDRTAWEVSFKWNGLFNVIFFLEGMLIICLYL